MAIQNRRGVYADFDPGKLKNGEYAIVQSGDPSTTDGDAIYIRVNASLVRRLATADEINDYENVIKELRDEVAKLKGDTSGLYEETFKLAERYQQAIDAVEKKRDQIVAFSSNAEQIAAEARQLANEVSGDLATQGVVVDQLKKNVDLLQLFVEGVVTGGYYDQSSNYIYLTNDAGETIGDPIGPVVGGTGSGGGGGGTGGETINAKMTVSDTTGWRSRTIAAGDPCRLTFTWSSIEDDLETGNGTAKVTVGGVVKGFVDIAQGDVVLDISRYLAQGANSIAVTISDVYGQARTIRYSVQVEVLSISSPFDSSVPVTGVISYPFTPVGAVNKTVHFFIDGTEIGSMETAVTNRQLTYTIPAQRHGAHTLDVYFDADINGVLVKSNTIHQVLMCTEALNDNVIIACPFDVDVAKQYTTLMYTYNVLDPNNLTADVVIKVNDRVFQEVTVDRTTQSFSVRAADVGALKVEISCGGQTWSHTTTIEESDVKVEPETEALKLALNAYGRSNNEANPGTWTYGTAGETDYTSCTFSNFGFVNDGWKQDEDGNTVLRTTGDARLNIPYKIFSNDPRTTGKTIELEFATRDVMDYDTEILSCWANGKGLKLTAQSALFKSEQSEVEIQFKEEEHIRLAFVVEKRSKNQLIYVYINGVLSRCVQYPNADDFQQTSPAGITIGSNSAAVDIYNIRVYDNDLTSQQVINNWIADTQDVDLMLGRFTRNDVYDAYGKIVIDKLPKTLPYGILIGPATPQYKGDNKTMDFSFVDNTRPAFNFTAVKLDVNVQGTSSQYYPVKNFKIKFKGGFQMANGTLVMKYALMDGYIEVATFTFKADVASSESANNTVLAMYYNDLCPAKTPPQESNASVRQGIAGFPMVMFWNNGSNTDFVGKYNWNLDKGTEEVFGFAEGDESWEIRNNTSNRVLFKSDDFESTAVDENGKTGPAWLQDFEARYPEDNTDYTKLKTMVSWLKSTDRTQATNAALPSSVTYEETQYTKDDASYRLAKFKAEVEDHFDLQDSIFYYLFTLIFLMVDSRAKNAFPTYWAKTGKWTWLPYDFDTANGTNNEGALVFGYSLEDFDTVDGADVYNGQNSVMWTNLRDAFGTEIRQMYLDLRRGQLSYSNVEGLFERHQGVWPEAVFNEDAQYKYIDPLINDGNKSYLSMLQGDKASQRQWWLYNRLRYLDSKFNAGDALTDTITLRGYAKSNITLTPYADIYPSIKYGSVLVQTRGERKKSCALACPLDNVNDTETYIYSASQLLDIGDISGYMVGFADFAAGKRLTNLKIGSNASGYSNPNLTELNIGTLPLLKTIDVRNCPNLAQTVDLSQCVNLETAYFDGSGIAGVDLANGAAIKVLHLPNTVTNLTLRNLQNLTDFTMAGYSNISTLWLEGNNSKVNPYTIFSACAAGARVRILGIQWSITGGATNTTTFLNRLEGMRGLDENGNNVKYAQLSGSIYFATISGSQLQLMKDHYPNVTVSYGTLQYSVDMYSEDGTTLLKSNAVNSGGTVSSYTPSKASTAQYSYTFAGWANSIGGEVDANALRNIQSDKKLYAVFTPVLRTYSVKFYNESTLLQTVSNVPYGGTATYTATEPTKEGYEFTGWSPSPSNITGDTSVYAQFQLVQLEVTEIGDTWEAIKAAIDDGTYAMKYKVGMYKYLDLGAQGNIRMQIAAINRDVLADDTGNAALTWIAMEYLNTTHRMNPSIITNYSTNTVKAFTNSGNTWTSQNRYKVNTAKATWTISPEDAGTLNVAYKTSNGTASNNTITKLTVNGTDVVTNYANTTGSSYDVEFDTSSPVTVYVEYDQKKENNYYATITFSSATAFDVNAEVENVETRGSQTGYENGTGSIGGWTLTEMRSYLKETIKPLMPEIVRNNLKTVKKYTYDNVQSGTSYTSIKNNLSEDDLWIPSCYEVGFTGYESTGVKYASLFPTNDSRKRAKVGTTSANWWWLRSASSSNNFNAVSYDGGNYGNGAYANYGVVLGFCM